MKLKGKKSGGHYRIMALMVIICMFFSFQLIQQNLNLLSNFKLKNSQDNKVNLSSSSIPLTGWAGGCSIFFINSSLGWCGGALPNISHPGYTTNYAILQSNNSGNSWHFQEENIPENMNIIIDKIQFFNASHGYAMSRYNAFILKTSNGGETWNYTELPVTRLENYQIDDMYFFNYTHGIISNRSGIFMTYDSGNTWSFKSNNLFLKRFDFINSTYGFAIDFQVTPNENGPLYYTNDGGYNWNLVKGPKTEPQLKCFDFINATHGWAIEKNISDPFGDTHMIISTSDSGKNWNIQETFQHPSSLMYINYTSENHVFVAASNGIYITKDGGASWNYTDVRVQWNITSIRRQFFLDSNYGWLLCTRERYSSSEYYEPIVILKTTDGGESWILIEPHYSKTDLIHAAVGAQMGENENEVELIIIGGVIGGSIAASTGILIVIKQQKINKKKKLKKVSKETKPKWKKKSIGKSILPGEYVGMSDLSLEIKLRRLIKSQIPIDSIKDAGVLEFRNQEFNVLPINEINTILQLEIPNKFEKLEIIEELARLSPERREKMIESLKNIER